MGSSMLRRLSVVVAITGLIFAFAAPVWAQDYEGPSNAEIEQLRRALIKEYQAAGDRAERSRILQKLAALRAGQPRPGGSGPTPPAGQSIPSRGDSLRVSPGGSSFPFPSVDQLPGVPTPREQKAGSVGLGAGADEPSLFGFKKFSASTKLAEKKASAFFGTDAEGNNRFERSGRRVISRYGIETPEEGSSGTEEEKSRARRLAEKTEVGVTFLDERVGGELEKFETESGSDFKKRKDLAKGRAGVRFGAGNASVSGDVKFNPGKLDVGAGFTGKASVAAIDAKAEGQIGNDKLAAKGSGSGSVLKASAKLDTRIGVTKEFVGAKVEAGAGASVAEGTLSGSVASNWLGLEIGGSVSGSVLTAEARGKASAGWNRETKRFEIEVGGKVGALLAGVGANIKISLSKPSWWP